jgi:hypothetical protein
VIFGKELRDSDARPVRIPQALPLVNDRRTPVDADRSPAKRDSDTPPNLVPVRTRDTSAPPPRRPPPETRSQPRPEARQPERRPDTRTPERRVEPRQPAPRRVDPPSRGRRPAVRHPI